MKKTLLCLAIGAFLLTASRVANADVSVDFFYNNLSGGSWIEVGDYGYCWQPDVAVGNASWRPYSDGYWAYTDVGWTWVSYEDFGWATYHYGRWALLSDYGWVWVPGRDADLEWGPAWVSWRTGGECIGWAPLPPETIGVIYSRPISGAIDFELNIGPAYYNFVDVRYIGEPVLRERIVPVTQNVTYIQQTVNVTNIAYNNKTVYNYGPDINVVNRVSNRPVQRLRLDREQNVDIATAAKGGGLTKVQGDRLVVAAPSRITRAARQVAPPAVKTKVDAGKVDRGWSVAGDAKTQAELKDRLKTQNSKNVPPLGAAPTGQANAARAASPAAAGAEAGQAGQGRERGRHSRRGAEGMAGTSPRPGAATGVSPAQGAAAETRQGRHGQGQQDNRFPTPAQENVQGAGAAPAGAAIGAAAAQHGQADQGQVPGQGRGRGGQGQAHNAPTPALDANTANPAEGAAGQRSQAAGGEGRQDHRGQMQGYGAEGRPGQPGAEQGQGQGRQGRRFHQPGETAPGETQGQGGGPRRPHERVQGNGQPGQQGDGQGQEEGRRGGRRGQGQASPAASPSPQR